MTESLKTVAALYVDPRGPYPKMEGVECWDATRDARKYDGPYPVVAHPPCQLWGNFAAINFKRWGGEHNRPGNDGGCFAHALKTVRRLGGVLEHPAHSHAWGAFDLMVPTHPYAWLRGRGARCREWVCEVWQSAYGHLARKRTWLLYVGNVGPHDPIWAREPGTHRIGHDHKERTHKPVLRGRLASETPLPFAEYLVRLARNS